MGGGLSPVGGRPRRGELPLPAGGQKVLWGGRADEQLRLPTPCPRSGLQGQILEETLKPQAQQLQARRSRFQGLAPLEDVGRAARDVQMVSVH